MVSEPSLSHKVKSPHIYTAELCSSYNLIEAQGSSATRPRIPWRFDYCVWFLCLVCLGASRLFSARASSSGPCACGACSWQLLYRRLHLS